MIDVSTLSFGINLPKSAQKNMHRATETPMEKKKKKTRTNAREKFANDGV